jgi:hypothetical protein
MLVLWQGNTKLADERLELPSVFMKLYFSRALCDIPETALFFHSVTTTYLYYGL